MDKDKQKRNWKKKWTMFWTIQYCRYRLADSNFHQGNPTVEEYNKAYKVLK